MTTAPCHQPAAAAVGPPGDVTLLLVGRPNSGKSSLFNAVTGGGAKVGNYPGITVEVLEADVTMPGGGRARVVDLPGTYSLEAAVDPDSDEGIARRTLEAQRGAPGVLVAQVLDCTHLAGNLRLTQELVRLGMPFVLVVTHRDALEEDGGALDVAALERAVGVPVLWVSARGRQTRGEVLAALAGWAAAPPPPPSRPSFDPGALAAAVVRAGGAPAEGARGQAPRLRLHARTERLDRVLMHPALGPLCFLVLMSALFTAVFLVADPASIAVGGAIDLLSAGVQRLLGDGLASSFVTEGVIGGAGTVVQFLPQIVLLTVALELIEASGYLARGAYLLDRLLRLFGLGGRSFVPLLMGHACAVPAIAATRAIRDPGQRLRTILVLPIMTCSARIPAYALLVMTFFAGLSAFGRALVFLGLYVVALVGGAVASAVLGAVLHRKRRSLPLVLELPPYRRPQLAVVARTAWRGGARFLREVGTVIVAVSAVLWVLLSVPVFSTPAHPVRPDAPPRTAAMARSLAARVGHALEPVTRPIGFDWRIDIGLIGSFGARELMVSTMGIIFGIENAEEDNVQGLADEIRTARAPDGRAAYSMATGLSLMIFFVFACQCMSTVAAIKRETGSWRWPAITLAYTYAAAYAASWVVYNGARALGLG